MVSNTVKAEEPSLETEVQNLLPNFIDAILRILDAGLENKIIVSGTIVSYNKKTKTATVKPATGVMEGTVWTNVSNQSLCDDLQPGDCVKMITPNRNQSDAWILSVFSNVMQRSIFVDFEKLVQTIKELTDYVNRIEFRLASAENRIANLESAVSALQSKSTT